MADIPNFKTTIKAPVGDQSKNFEKNFKKEMIKSAPDVKLNETDELLTEKEQSLKKKIFSLAKMEALVFSDPKLTAVYDEMAENGEEKYGYHYNETIMNMIFNDYVLNSPKYLQKYKMAIPKKKKRRDKSGINQLKKAGEKSMGKSKLAEGDDSLPVKVQFLVNEKDPTNPDVFAYFPEENHDAAGKFKMAYSHIGQHSPCHPEYARESRPATPEEYVDLKAELEGIGYNLDVIESMNETTSAGSAGGAAGYVGYATPAAWGSGDLMKTKGKSNVMRKPIWKGGAIIAESNYLTDPTGFEKYVDELNEQINYIKKHSEGYGDLENMKPEDLKIIKKDIQTGKMDDPDLGLEEQATNKIKTVEELKAFLAAQGRKLTKEDIPNLAGEVLYKVAINTANKMLPMRWDDLPDVNSMWDYIDENGGMSHEEFVQAVKEAVNDRLSEEGFSLDDLMGEGKIDEKAKSKAQQKFMGMVHAVQKGELSPDKVSGDVVKAADSMKKKDAEDFAATKHKGLPEKVKPKKKLNEFLSLHDTVEYVSDREGENPFEMNGIRWQFVNAKYPDGKVDIGVYRFGHDLVYDYSRWREEMNINETDQPMIDANPQTMANKPTPIGDLGNSVDMGTRPMGENKVFIKNDIVMNENEQKLLEELNNELEAHTIHHNKLMKMTEDRKPSALVMRDRLGSENEKNFKSDLQDSGTKEIIDVEKELQWKDQQTNVGDDPQKLGQDIEKKEVQVTDAKGEEALKNVGDSANNEGDEIPKRNLTSEEQKEVDMYRLGQQDLVYDNKPSERFEERMKADMGEELYKQRQEKLEFRGKAPMYNKDPQPVEDTTSDKVQFNKEQTGWNERVGLKEGVVSAKYVNELGKTKFVDFDLKDVVEVTEITEAHVPLNLKGMGNVYSSKVELKESVSKAIEEWNFYLLESNVVVHKPVQTLNESENKAEKPIVSEQFEKIKHLTGYKPNKFVDTKNVKKNRGF